MKGSLSLCMFGTGENAVRVDGESTMLLHGDCSEQLNAAGIFYLCFSI